MADRILTSAEEEARISRAIMVWINGWSGIPETISRINFEQLEDDKPSMALSTIQGAYIVRRYITGGHMGEYQYKLIYRIKPATSNDARLKADEVLNDFGAWAADNPPTIGNGNTRMEAVSRASIFAAYENGDEDHQILMKLTYEVI